MLPLAPALLFAPVPPAEPPAPLAPFVAPPSGDSPDVTVQAAPESNSKATQGFEKDIRMVSLPGRRMGRHLVGVSGRAAKGAANDQGGDSTTTIAHLFTRTASDFGPGQGRRARAGALGHSIVWFVTLAETTRLGGAPMFEGSHPPDSMGPNSETPIW
jgi:hypothetical protein